MAADPYTMQILKVLFQQRETRNPVGLLGSKLLMPLLCPLETDLSAQVLEEPMVMSGGIAAKHVLRMSMHSRVRSMVKNVSSAATVFEENLEGIWTFVSHPRGRKSRRST
jgi:hypothetical protein